MKTDLSQQSLRAFSKKDSDRLLISMIRDLCLDGFKPNTIAAISRGGLVMGVQLSHYFAVPLLVITADSAKQPRRDLAYDELITVIKAGQNVLLVDEICDKGDTLRNISDALYQHFGAHSRTGYLGANLKTAVLVHNEGEKLFYPDYIGEAINKYEDPSWIVFDWESWW